MTLWLRVRHAQAALAALGLFAAITVLAGDVAIAMPAFLAVYGLSVPVVLLAPLILPTVVGWGLQLGEARLERVSTRPISLLDTGFATTIAVLGCVIALAIGALTTSVYAGAAGRNAVGYMGLMLVGQRLIGVRAAPLIPAAVAMLAALAGGDASGQPQWWVWLLKPVDEPSAWIAAIACLGIGVVLSLEPSRGPLLTDLVDSD